MIIDFVGDYARQWEMHEKKRCIYSFRMGEECEFIVKNSDSDL